MHEPETGHMVEVNPEEAKEYKDRGFCILEVGEQIKVKNVNYTVFSFQNKKLLIEKCEYDMLDVGEKINIKGANFVVESKGLKIATLRGLPGNIIVPQERVDAYRKKAIEDIRKEK